MKASRADLALDCRSATREKGGVPLCLAGSPQGLETSPHRVVCIFVVVPDRIPRLRLTLYWRSPLADEGLTIRELGLFSARQTDLECGAATSSSEAIRQG